MPVRRRGRPRPGRSAGWDRARGRIRSRTRRKPGRAAGPSRQLRTGCRSARPDTARSQSPRASSRRFRSSARSRRNWGAAGGDRRAGSSDCSSERADMPARPAGGCPPLPEPAERRQAARPPPEGQLFARAAGLSSTRRNGSSRPRAACRPVRRSRPCPRRTGRGRAHPPRSLPCERFRRPRAPAHRAPASAPTRR